MKDVENVDIDKLVESLEDAKKIIEQVIPMFWQRNAPATIDYAIEVLKAQHELIYELFEDIEMH